MPKNRPTAVDIPTPTITALVGEASDPGTLAPFRMKLGRDTEPIAGCCRVVANFPAQGSVRMAATFEEIAKEGRSRIETLVFDAICSEIRVMLRSEQQQDSQTRPTLPDPLAMTPIL